MLKHFLEKWRLWEEAFLGIDDLQGDYLFSLEKRVARLEAATEALDRKRLPATLPVSIRRGPQCQLFLRDLRFHFAARASTFLRRLVASRSPGS